jgi:sec-independent protein translocase protein TatA
MMNPTLAVLGLGPGEIAVIALIALLFFGSRLPKVARSLGQSVNEFKSGLKDANQTDTESDETGKKRA